MTKITNKQIRREFGHNGFECKVVVRRNGDVERFGSPVDTDRSKDYWQFLGNKCDLYGLSSTND